MTTHAGWIPLSPAQRGLFFAQRLDPDNPCYTTAEIVAFDRRVDVDRLSRALGDAYGEHEQLRTEFSFGTEGPLQRVLEPVSVCIDVVELDSTDDAAAWLRAAHTRALRPERGEVTQTALLRLPHEDWWWHAAHHVVLDGYGAQQLLRRVAEIYDGASPTSPVLRLADLVDTAVPDDPDADAFWAARLAAMHGPASLAGHAAAPAAAALRRSMAIDAQTQQQLVDAARRLGVPWSELFTVAVGTYLSRMAGQPGIRIGVPLMNRVLPGVGALPAARTVCTAMNVLPITISAQGSLADALAHAGTEVAAVRAHPFLRQEDLARQLGERGQLFGAQVNVIPFDLQLRFGDAHGVVRNVTAGPVEDITVGVRGVPARGRVMRLELDANPALYPEDEMDAHLDRLITWIRTLCAAAADSRIDGLPLLAAAELRRVTHDFNDTARAHAPATLATRFAAQASKTPEAIALNSTEGERTYRELDDRARRIAASLRAHGVAAGDVVGVRLERGLALYESVHALAILGAVYLPIDPDLPAERVEWMNEDARVAFVIDDVEPHIGIDRVANEHTAVDTPAYVLFTSGSTGRPKGVVVSHRAIDNRLAWMQQALPLDVGDVVLHKTPISFDVSIWELFWPLQTGATVRIAPPGAHRDPRVLAALLDDVDVVHFVPSMLRALLNDRQARERLTGVRHVVTSGEALTPDLVDRSARWLGAAPLNLYGPTEAAVDVTAWQTSPGDVAVPIGRPVWNTTCLVLDTAGRPVPVGATGELWLGGVQLADGYIGRPDLTDERFPDTPFGRLYRTGDLAAWRADGALRYLGRTDDQVKVRGQRVELGEIEAVVARLDGVSAAVVGLVDDALICWYTGSADADAVRSAAAGVLPAAWVPHRWVCVEEIPVGVSGKADRRALASARPPAEADGRAPVSLTEQRVCEIVAAVLGLPAIAPDADLFSMGADSLRVLRIISAIDDALGGAIGFADAFAHPTCAGLAALLSHDERADGLDEVLVLRRGDATRPPLVLLPPAGGLGWCYTRLLPHLPVDLPVFAVQAPGIRDGAPQPVDSLTALAERQLATIRSVIGHARFHVAGWSLGGMAAHAVASLARTDGQDVGAVVLLDAYPPQQWATLPEPTQHDALLGLLRLGAVDLPDGTPLDREVVGDALRSSGSALAALPPEVVDGCVAAVLEAARIVRTPLPTVLDADAHLVVATAPRAETWLDAEGWRPTLTGTLHRTDVASTHGELIRRADVALLLAEWVS